MAKRKRKKQSNSTGFKFSVEITGLILILVGIIGLGVFGSVGNIIKEFAIFLFGAYYNVLIVLVLVLGAYMLIKRSLPNFFNSRLMGLYLLVISFLTFAHMNHIEPGIKFGAAINNSTEVYLAVIGEKYVNLSQTGGGIVGLVSSWALVSLLDKVGTYIILVVLSIFGIVMMFNVSFFDLVDKIVDMWKNRERPEKKEKKEKNKKTMYDQDDEDEANDILINSVQDIKNEIKEEKTKVEVSSPVQEVPLITVNSNYRLPRLDEVLDPIKKNKKQNSEDFIKQTSIALQNVLADFQITGKVVAVHEGPTVTQFEVAIKNGTKVSKITSISKEIALSLAAKDVRIEAPIPGKTTVGIEIPNKVTFGVQVREILEARQKDMANMKIPVTLGKDINGNTCICDLSKTPHLLVAGSTGSGKSVCINSFINSILINKRPDEVKLLLVDPKKVELSNYNGIPHLLCPVVSDPKKASIALQNIVKEMEKRYDMFADEKVKNISGYNEKMALLKKKNPDDNTIQLMSYIVVIIDELADLMLVASKEVEDSIMRITQMARAAGIHLIVATQRPSTDVITGVVKANIPSRISFAVASQIDSRTILDMGGAEKLLGKGDMLYKPMGENTPLRIQGNFISDEEIERVIAYVSKEQAASYDESITQVSDSSISSSNVGGERDTDEDDPLYNEIVDFAIETRKVSASLLQRRFRLGYNRAARIVDILEERGIIGPANGSKPREVLIGKDGIPLQDE
ncbi:MAG: DNA translocase FtsK 4TM domain-containing protein [Erysipelotrichales bacterium]|nr:DNA translocase FtsK 4TM domain-containing protein [Erysipelotrichales bacterium]